MTRRGLSTLPLAGLLLVSSLAGPPVAAAAPTPVLPLRPAAVAAAPAATIRVLPQGAVRAEGAGAVIAVRITCAVPQGRVRLWVTLPHVSSDGSTPLGSRWARECTPEGRRYLVPVTTGGTTVIPAGPVDVRAELALCLHARACFTTVRGRADLTDRDDLDRPRRAYPQGYSTVMPRVRLAADNISVDGRHAHRCRGGRAHSGQILLTQRPSEGRVALATGSLAAMLCDDTRHAVTTTFESLSPLRQGSAFVVLHVFLCPPPPEERCGVHVAWREVTAVGPTRAAARR